MFENLNTKIGLVYAKALTKRDEVNAQLAARLSTGPDIGSDEGIDDAVWKIAVVAAVVFLAVGFLSNLRTAIADRGQAAVDAINGLP